MWVALGNEVGKVCEEGDKIGEDGRGRLSQMVDWTCTEGMI